MIGNISILGFTVMLVSSITCLVIGFWIKRTGSGKQGKCLYKLLQKRESGKRRTPALLVGGNLPPKNTYRRAIWQRTFGASRRTINARPALSFFASVAPAAQDTGSGSPDEPEAL